MKAFSSDLVDHLATGATTLCRCWRVVRADGAELDFTDHDRTVSFAGLDYEPGTGLDASDAVAHAGLPVGGMEVAGAFSSAQLTEADLDAGLYDNAGVETWLVNWADPAMRHLLASGSIGEVRREDGAFTAEIRGPAHALSQQQGRLFQFTCDADLGDQRCTIDLTDPQYLASASVTGFEDRQTIFCDLFAGQPDGFFDRGLVTFTAGANAGAAMEVRRHRDEAARARIDLWLPMANPLAAGDIFSITAGCDKRFVTCRDRFANAVNFRGFPHIPGNDFALSYALSGAGNDGKPLKTT